MKEREEFLKKEQEQKELEKKQKEETEKVKKEVSEYRKCIEQLQKNIRQSGENIRNWFKLFDENNDDFMEMEDFKKLLRQVNVVVRDQDLQRVFELMDLQQVGRLSYNDFCDVIERNVQLPIEKIVRKRRQDRGEAFIEGLDKAEDFGQTQNIKSFLGEFSSTVQKDIGTVEGMSSLMRKS